MCDTELGPGEATVLEIKESSFLKKRSKRLLFFVPEHSLARNRNARAGTRT
jgi:hypothetical protein